MNGLRPGDRVLFRDGDRFGVARVDLVRERDITGFPFDANRARWSPHNRRIAASFVVGKLAPGENAERVAAKLTRLAKEREAARQQADRAMAEAVQGLTRP